MWKNLATMHIQEKNMQAKAKHNSTVWKLQRTSNNELNKKSYFLPILEQTNPKITSERKRKQERKPGDYNWSKGKESKEKKKILAGTS